ncbi:MAG TPA: ribulose-phosphate 3-epimerase [Gemmatimonadaceae bacterium]|nr:ribulose-phosphate 3-epimerase [Gemmatimonadaceae bacterium]
MTVKPIRIAPSILSADFACLRDEIDMCIQGGADWIHVDVMDGQFVPNLTFGTKVIDAVRRCTDLPIDVHLMVIHPESYFEDFARAGATGLTIHAEATVHLQRHLSHIRSLGCRAGVAINPATSLDSVREVTDDIDLLLVMTVNPGFGGQAFIPASIDKIRRARRLLDESRSDADLEVDGGVARDTILQCRRAGADTFVAGNAIFSASRPSAEIGELRAAATELA